MLEANRNQLEMLIKWDEKAFIDSEKAGHDMSAKRNKRGSDP